MILLDLHLQKEYCSRYYKRQDRFTPDATPPTIDSPAYIEYEEFRLGDSIALHPADANPQSYFIYGNTTR